MRRSHLCFASVLTLLVTCTFQFQAHAAPAGPLVKHLSSLLKWTARSSLKMPRSDENVLQFEDGYLVETVVEGNEIGVVPYKIRVSGDGELYAVDEVNSNIVKITPPLSQCVTTIAGGKSSIAGYRDGPSEDAKFSTDFDVVYVHSTCSLLVVDRGNAAIRQISLNQEDCDYESTSVTASDLLMVVGAVLAGYVTFMLQQGFGPSFFSRTQQYSESEFKGYPSVEKPSPITESMKEEPKWPSFGQLIIDLSKLALEALASMFLYLIPSWVRSSGSKKCLTPLKDSLRMPEDEIEPPSVQRQSVPVSLSETRQVHTPSTNDKYSDMKPPKIKSASFKDPSLSSKHRSLKRQEYAEFYGSGEMPSTGRSKSHREKTRHRQRDRSGEVVFGAAGTEPKAAEMKPVGYDNPKFDHYNMKSKYGSDNAYQF